MLPGSQFNGILAAMMVVTVVFVGVGVTYFSHAADVASVSVPVLTNLVPTGDVINRGVVGYDVNGVPKNQTQNLYKDVDDGGATRFMDSDNTYVANDPSFGSGGANIFSHMVSYSGAPAGRVIAADVNFSARTLSASGQARVEVLDGLQLVATGPWHSLNAGYQNFSDHFAGLNMVSANNLHTQVDMMKDANSTGVRYSQIWVDASIQPPTSYWIKPASQLDYGGIVGVNNGVTSQTDMLADVDDGVNFAAADDNLTFVRTQHAPEDGQDKMEFQATPKGTLVGVNVNWRAKKTSDGVAQAGVELWYGNTMLAAAPTRSLNNSYTNYTEKFNNLNVQVVDGTLLRAKVLLYNPNGSGDVRFTQIWLRADEVLPL